MKEKNTTHAGKKTPAAHAFVKALPAISAAVCLATALGIVFVTGVWKNVFPELSETSGTPASENTFENGNGTLLTEQNGHTSENEAKVHSLEEFYMDFGFANEPSAGEGFLSLSASGYPCITVEYEEERENPSGNEKTDTTDFTNSSDVYTVYAGLTVYRELYTAIQGADADTAFVIYAINASPEYGYTDFEYAGKTPHELYEELNALGYRQHALPAFIDYVQKLRENLEENPEYSTAELLFELDGEMGIYDQETIAGFKSRYIKIGEDDGTFFFDDDAAYADKEAIDARVREINGLDHEMRAAYYKEYVRVDISALGEYGAYVFEDDDTVYASVTKKQLENIAEQINVTGIAFYSALKDHSR